MQRTLDALFAAARAQVGARRSSADAHAVLRAACEGTAALAAERGISLVEAPCGHPLQLDAEADLAERALAPVINNACRFAAREVSVSIAKQEGDIVFRVADDGPGVRAEECERIFEPGVQGSAALREAGATEVRGAGLGLALARRLARAAGGDVQASADAAGGRFSVRLPPA